MSRKVFNLIFALANFNAFAKIAAEGNDTKINYCKINPCHREGTSECKNENKTHRCICKIGWNGEDCFNNIDNCSPNQCLNNATCEDLEGTFRCNCTEGYIGKICSYKNLCLTKVCDENKSCIVQDNNTAACECKRNGFEGVNCDQDIDECKQMNICGRGHCINKNGSYICQCLPGWKGNRCDLRVEYCKNEPCKNDGVCLEEETTFRCKCLSNFTGAHCDVESLCNKSDPCVHGDCQPNGRGYICTCEPGWQGVNCNQSIVNQSGCDAFPCKNGGTCENVAEFDYKCICKSSFTGRTCDFPITTCLFNQCENNSTCKQSSKDKYICECKRGFKGKYCEKNIIECLKNKCVNGTCVDGIDNYRCKCDQKWTGEYCDRKKTTPKCDTHCDKSRGVCVDGVCVCIENFEGEYCNIKTQHCYNDTCFNNGICIENKDSYQCNCSQGYYGSRCQFVQDQCFKCLSYGTKQCTNYPGGYYCDCIDGYNGVNCENNINDCFRKSCGDNKYCFDLVNNFTCSCKLGFSGVNCTKSTCSDNPCGHGSCKSNVDGTYVCDCDAGFEGVNCDIKSVPCMMDCGYGHCVNEICICSAGYTGANCTTNIDDCVYHNCGEHGECHDLVNAAECTCQDGFYGESCSFDHSFCSKCQNGASCVAGPKQFICSCLSGFNGKYCEIEHTKCPYPECSSTFDGKKCDAKCNIHQCNWDGTDCSLGLSPWKTCKATKCWTLFGNGKCDTQCNNEDCMYDNFDCSPPKQCPNNEFCLKAYNNSVCDKVCNVKECGFDDLECEVNTPPQKVAGILVVDVFTTLQNFSSYQKDFERSLGIILNSNAKVLQAFAVNAIIASRKKRSASQPIVRTKVSLDNAKCTSGCFKSAALAARYLGAKASKNELNLPFWLRSVESTKGEQPGGSKTPSWLWSTIIAVAAVLSLVGVVAGVKRIAATLWRPETQPTTGARAGPEGQEGDELMSLHQSSSESIGSARDIKAFKADMIGSLGSHEWLNAYQRDTSTEDSLENSHLKFLHEIKKTMPTSKNREYIFRMMEAGVDINVRDVDGRTPLHLSLNHRELFLTILKHRNCHIDAQSYDGSTPLMDACRINDSSFVEELITNGAKVTLVDKRGQSALHCAAKHNFDAHCLLLLRANAKIDLQDNKGQSPLFLAARDNCLRVVDVLRLHCANVNCTDNMDVSPKVVAEMNGNFEVVRMLVDNTLPPTHSPQFIPSPPHNNISPTHIRPKLDFTIDNEHRYIRPQPAQNSKRPRKHARPNTANKKRKNEMMKNYNNEFIFAANEQPCFTYATHQQCLNEFPTDWTIPTSERFDFNTNEPSFTTFPTNNQYGQYNNYPTPPSVGIQSPNIINSPTYNLPLSYLTPSPDSLSPDPTEA